MRKDRFSPRKTRVNGQVFWQIALPSKLKIGEDGRPRRIRQRRTFRHFDEAMVYAEQTRIGVKNLGAAAFSLSDRQRIDAIEAAAVLEPFGVSLTQSAKFFANHNRRIAESVTVAHAVKELLASKAHDNLRPRYLTDLRVRLNRFSETFGTIKIAILTGNEIDAWLRSFAWKPLTRNTMRLRLSTLFAYAVGRGWRESNPIEEVRKVKSSGGAIEILTPEQLSRLLEASDERTLPYHLLGAFAGLRRAEVERLEWEDIHFDEGLVEVPALKSKTVSRRFVKIQPNLAAWLEEYRGRSGNVCPPNLPVRLAIDRKAAGIKPWPVNALRHSFASYSLAHFNDAAKLALELGHTNQDLLFKCYRELVKPAVAARYWSIRPEPQTKLVAISA
jgi:integrase